VERPAGRLGQHAAGLLREGRDDRVDLGVSLLDPLERQFQELRRVGITGRELIRLLAERPIEKAHLVSSA
jgi:hypothetical protein